jgi:hypothetical protein
LLEHGEYYSARSHQVMLYAGRGPWNNEAVAQGARLMVKAMEGLDFNQPWAQLSCLFGEAMLPPAAYQNFLKHTLIRKQKGLSYLSLVIQDSDIEMTIKHQLSQAYNQADIEHEFFPTIEAGLNAIRSRGFMLNDNDLALFFANSIFQPRNL